MSAQISAMSKSRLRSTQASRLRSSANGQRAVGIIEAIEQDLGITLVTANQLILWHSLKLANRSPVIQGYGRLFATLG
ncbi:hypothetical protein C5748_14235 [Phyllobacterium phragmitis]|uniref:Uncharacterized protein n=1 Tax=Phyllobacterium phragmitis TaxID=2670329 RepID=A0A2S9IQZ0_9HYPH|nr:hypothetical protein C5748_14235 [Phyllobacterium phragmitis]